MSDLFPEAVQDSPKLAWLKRHRLAVSATTKFPPFCCHNGGHTYVTFGETEDEAILAYCEKYNVKHWTLEDAR